MVLGFTHASTAQDTDIMFTWIIPVAAYLVGSLSSAIILARLLGLPDPRSSGSNNPGATNMLRLGGKWVAAATLIVDVAKGVLPVIVAKALTDNDWVIAATVVGAFLGHLYPLYFGFVGGKGVATAFGAMLGLSPWLALALVLIWILFAATTRYSSLAALVATGLSPIIISILVPGWPYLWASLILAGFIYWRHRSNIERLRNRSESRISLGR